MVGHLPKRHRRTLAVLALGTCIVLGLWVGANPATPVLASVGAAAGLLVGAGLAWALAHESRRGAEAVRFTSRSGPRPH